MQTQKLDLSIYNNLFDAITAPYTQMYRLNSISLPSLKMVLRNGKQIVVENGQIKNSQEVPTHEIITLEGTAANSKFSITLKNLATGNTEVINLHNS